MFVYLLTKLNFWNVWKFSFNLRHIFEPWGINRSSKHTPLMERGKKLYIVDLPKRLRYISNFYVPLWQHCLANTTFLEFSGNSPVVEDCDFSEEEPRGKITLKGGFNCVQGCPKAFCMISWTNLQIVPQYYWSSILILIPCLPHFIGVYRHCTIHLLWMLKGKIHFAVETCEQIKMFTLVLRRVLKRFHGNYSRDNQEKEAHFLKEKKYRNTSVIILP